MVGRHGHFECRIVFGIFQGIDNGFRREAKSDSVLPGLSLALFGKGSGAELRVAPVRLDLSEGGHFVSGRRIGFVSSFCSRATAPTSHALKFVGRCVAGGDLASGVAACVRATGEPLRHQARSSPNRWSSRW
jgi:hypothetical protein